MPDLRVFGKTEKGSAELATRSGALSMAQRRLLILVDGVRDVDQLAAIVPTGFEASLRALEDALENFAGCAVVISHDRFFLDRLATHILAFEGNSHVEWFEGNFEAYEEDKRRRMGDAAVRPTRLAYKKLTR